MAISDEICVFDDIYLMVERVWDAARNTLIALLVLTHTSHTFPADFFGAPKKVIWGVLGTNARPDHFAQILIVEFRF